MSTLCQSCVLFGRDTGDLLHLPHASSAVEGKGIGSWIRNSAVTQHNQPIRTHHHVVAKQVAVTYNTACSPY